MLGHLAGVVRHSHFIRRAEDLASRGHLLLTSKPVAASTISWEDRIASHGRRQDVVIDIINTLASICASIESGTCTAIWSPSKSALNAAQTEDATRIAFPSTGPDRRLNAKACQRGARFRRWGVP